MSTRQVYVSAQYATAAARIAQATLLPGCDVLPATRFGRRAAMPVIEWDLDVLADRVARAPAPMLDRKVLQYRLMEGWSAEAPLHVRSYVSVGPLSWQHVRRIGALAGWHPVVIVVPTSESMDPVDVAECDVLGYSVLSVDVPNRTVEVVVRGAEHGLSEGRAELRDLYWQRAEQLYDIALRVDAVPKVATP